MFKELPFDAYQMYVQNLKYTSQFKNATAVLMPDGRVVLVENNQIVGETRRLRFCRFGHSPERARKFLSNIGAEDKCIDLSSLKEEQVNLVCRASELIANERDGMVQRSRQQSERGKGKQGKFNPFKQFLLNAKITNCAQLLKRLSDVKAANEFALRHGIPISFDDSTIEELKEAIATSNRALEISTIEGTRWISREKEQRPVLLNEVHRARKLGSIQSMLSEVKKILSKK